MRSLANGNEASASEHVEIVGFAASETEPDKPATANLDAPHRTLPAIQIRQITVAQDHVAKLHAGRVARTQHHAPELRFRNPNSMR